MFLLLLYGFPVEMRFEGVHGMKWATRYLRWTRRTRNPSSFCLSLQKAYHWRYPEQYSQYRILIYTIFSYNKLDNCIFYACRKKKGHMFLRKSSILLWKCMITLTTRTFPAFLYYSFGLKVNENEQEHILNHDSRKLAFFYGPDYQLRVWRTVWGH